MPYLDIEGVKLLEDGDMVVKSFRDNGHFEKKSLEKWKEYTTKGVSLDIGSYSGLYAILSNCLSIAYEPNPFMALRIAHNSFVNNKPVYLIQMAAGEKDGTGALKMNFHTSSATKVVPGNEVRIVPAIHDDVCAVKIDVEGMELEVLKGLKELPDLVIVEALTDKSELDLINFMQGYTFERDERNLIFERRNSS